MRFDVTRVLALVAGMSVLSCTDLPTHPRSSLRPVDGARRNVTGTAVVISQVYGGGGNAGSTYKNDFIELYNPTSEAISLDGWSVQYASATGTSWTNKTNLAGSIAAGAYYLVQEAAGTTPGGGTTALPTPDAVGPIAMAAGAAKVALVNTTTVLSGGCPASVTIVDFVGYGSAATCFEGSGPTATLTSGTAAIRNGGGAQDSNNNSADFTTGAPVPHNSGNTGPTVGALDHVVVSGPSSVAVGSSVTLTAALRDAANLTIGDPTATYTWSSSDPAVAQVTSSSGSNATVTGVQVACPVKISVAATSNGVTKTGFQWLGVTSSLGHITLSAGTSPLVIGYQTQIFVNTGSTDQSGAPVSFADVTWSSCDPSVLSIDSHGLVTAAGDGTVALTATAHDGSSGTLILSTEVPFYSETARKGHNTELGLPTDNDASNDVIIARKQYTLSYNPQRGGPNWVSWDLSATHLGSRDRCNCYSADTALARLGYGQSMYTTLDYTGGGYDRGHMEPSADQTTTDGENAETFFLTNFLPQQHGLNAGPWEAFEGALRDSVKAGREAYVIAGGVFTNGVGLGSLKNEGKIFIPDSTWKIVVLMPANTGLGDITSATDVDVIAVNMPNVSDPGPKADWMAFKTTVAKIQRSTGYDFLSALPEPIQCNLEGNCPPIARITGSGTAGGDEGQALTFDASTSSDPDAGNTLTYAWTVNGVAAGSQQTLSYTFPTFGTFDVKLTVTDDFGAASAATTSVVIHDVAPTLGPIPDATILRGETYAASSGFTDPGANSWAATVDYGDGSGSHALALTGETFTLSHQYGAPGRYTVGVGIFDGSLTGTGSATVIVISPADGITELGISVSALGGGEANTGQANSLQAKLRAAAAQLAAGNDRAAINTLGAFINEVDALVRSGRVTDTAASPITSYARRLIESIRKG